MTLTIFRGLPSPFDNRQLKDYSNIKKQRKEQLKRLLIFLRLVFLRFSLESSVKLFAREPAARL